MKTFVSRRMLLVALAILVLLGCGTILAINKFLDLDSYKEQILAEVSKALHRKVQYEKGEVSFRFGPSFSFTMVVVKEKEDDRLFLSADRLTASLKLLPLLQKKVVIRELSLERPRIAISRDTTGRFNISDLLEGDSKETSLEISGLRLKKGELTFVDLGAGNGVKVTTALKDMDLSISRLKRGKTCNFRLVTTIADAVKPGSISLSGSAKLAPAGKPLVETRLLHTDLQLKNIIIDHFWPYYSRYVPFRQIFGRIDFDGSFKGKLAEFTSKGKVRMSGVRFHYPQVFHAVLTPNRLAFSYEFELSRRDVTVKSIDLNVDGLNVKGSCAIKEFPSGDPRIVAKAVTSQFNLQQFGQYIPYGIIVKDTADFIEQKIKGGIYRLDDGRLDGLVSQILHMERGENYNVLAIKGRVEKGLINYGASIPTFNNIKGTLEMRGKDFLLTSMTGNFGTSPFALDGKISDYPLDTPSAYPFSMKITPRQPEVAWLMGKEHGSKVALSGDSSLQLNGAGGTGSYQLNGNWNLTPSSYSYPDIVSKPSGRANSLAFSTTFTKNDIRLANLQFNMTPLALNINGSYRYNDKNPLALAIKSNQVQLTEIATMLPLAKKYQAAGRIEASVHGESQGRDREGLFWRGQITMKDFSCKPTEEMKTVSNINGLLTFNGTNLESSQLTVRLGNSTVTAKGKLSGFSNPAIHLVFASPRLDVTDFGLSPPRKELLITDVQGSITLKDNNLQIKSMSGHVNKTFLQIRGSIRNLRNPKTDLTVSSSFLDLNDILILTALEHTTQQRDLNLSRPVLKATVRADTGKAWGFDFERLRGTLLFQDNILYIQPLELSAMGGKASARIRIDSGADGKPSRSQLSCNLSKVSADQFMQALGGKRREITGNLSLQAELTAKGETSDELKKSALGSVQLRIEDGSLRRFGVLSKIFSILNVSQLLKLQLPDMVADGMPFNNIRASYSIQDGIISSNDFFVSSDAMNISAIGSVNLIKNELDVTIGVQPLQTVDKIINRIPIVGWILTGNDKSFITTYFEAKGKLDDPTVSAIPVKSMARGVFDIFKRVFELPARLITDTGEVIIGK